MTLQFNIVIAQSNLDIRALLGKIPRGAYCISYIEIAQKMKSSDHYSVKPSDHVIFTTMWKQLNKALKSNKIKQIYLILTSLNESQLDIIFNFINKSVPRCEFVIYSNDSKHEILKRKLQSLNLSNNGKD